MKKILFLSAFCLAAFGVDVEIKDIYSRSSIAGVPNSAVFMNITNKQNTAIKLIGASSPASQEAQLHTHIKENEMMKMIKVENFEIPVNGTLELKPGGNHIMLLGLKNELKAGDKIDLKLDFEDGQSVELKDIVVKDLKNSMKNSANHAHH